MALDDGDRTGVVGGKMVGDAHPNDAAADDHDIRGFGNESLHDQ